MAESPFKRVILKLSGESLKGSREFGIDPAAVAYIADEINRAVSRNHELGIVVGGGNFWRGADYSAAGMDRSTADSAGMLATIMNALSLQDSLERVGLTVRTQSAINMPAVAEPFIRRRAMRHLEKGRVVIFAGGTGNPFMSTDTAAALRALDIGAEALLMAKNDVDGVYTADPHLHADAKKLTFLTPIDALRRRLAVLDSTALSMCMDNGLPIVVFDMFKPGNLQLVLEGRTVGTLIADVQPSGAA